MEKIKEILKKIGKALWSKPVLLAISISLLGVFSFTIDEYQLAQLICLLPFVNGC